MGALASGVSGLKAHQTMLDVTGNNLANVNTMAFKSSSVNFSEMLSQTFRSASPPSGDGSSSAGSLGGTNPLQIGSGVQLSSVDRNMSQGNMRNTGQALDMAIEGSGYFTLNDGKSDLYTRVGLFDVDSGNFLVDAATGYRVQRTGSEGVSDGFQIAGVDNIHIPFDVRLQAKTTTEVVVTGNLSANNITPTTNFLRSTIQFTKNGAAVSLTDTLDLLDQYTGTKAVTDEITISGTQRDGTAVSTAFSFDAGGGVWKTVGDLLDAITVAFGGSSVSTATLNDGKFELKDTDSGYSQTNLFLTYSTGTGAFELPKHFEAIEVGGEVAHSTNITMFDGFGEAHEGQITFVRTDAGTNTWDLVLNTLSGSVEFMDRRVMGLNFLTNGSYNGVAGALSFQVRFPNDPTNTRTVTLDLGTIGQYDGLSLAAGESTAAVSSQDGYKAGVLASISVGKDGVISGRFTNDVRRDIAALQITTFQNPGGLEAVGNNYFVATGNSGNPVATKGLAGSAGAVRGGVLEESNVEIAGEFVNLIQAQNGFQANARTIRVANDMLKELTNLIR